MFVESDCKDPASPGGAECFRSKATTNEPCDRMTAQRGEPARMVMERMQERSAPAEWESP